MTGTLRKVASGFWAELAPRRKRTNRHLVLHNRTSSRSRIGKSEREGRCRIPGLFAITRDRFNAAGLQVSTLKVPRGFCVYRLTPVRPQRPPERPTTVISRKSTQIASRRLSGNSSNRWRRYSDGSRPFAPYRAEVLKASPLTARSLRYCEANTRCGEKDNHDEHRRDENRSKTERDRRRRR